MAKKEKIFRETYMAFGYDIPIIGKCYECQILDNHKSNSLKMSKVKTSQVEDIKKIYNNVYVIKDRHYYYITKMVFIPDQDVRFVLIGEKPKIFSRIYFYYIDPIIPGNFSVDTSNIIIGIKTYKHFYIVKTMNYTYICLLI